MGPVLRGSVTVRLLVLIWLEGAVIAGAVVLGAWLRLGDAAGPLFAVEGGWMKTLIVVFTCLMCLYYTDLYDLRVVADRRELVVRVVQALGAASFVLALVYYWFPSLSLGRGVFLITAFLVITFVTGGRLLFERLLHVIGPRERLLLIGTGQSAVDLARELHERRQELGVEIVGFIDPDASRLGESLVNPGIIGTLEDVPSIVRARSVDRVVVSLADARGKLPMDKLLEMKLDGVGFDHLASVYEEYTGKIAVENLRPSWLIFSSGFRKSGPLRMGKRLLDLAVAAALLLLLWPVMLLVALAVRMTSRGPALYHQPRVGQYGRVFTVHKFRSMVEHAEADTGAVWAAQNDARVTPIGGFLRRTRLDELPQLWNVLKGDMSLVGPRPERPEFVQRLTRDIPFYGQRHVVRPGLTGWAQVRYTYGASVEDALEKLQYDLFYIKHMSLALDMFVLLSTVKTVVQRRGA